MGAFGLKSANEAVDWNDEICSTITPRPYYELSKRFFDICGALIGLVLLSPLLFGIGLAVKLSSSGAILYCGVRVGLYGRPFQIFKFRSMVVNAELGAGTTSKNDVRITPVGRFIRRYKLDELPQLFNVLIGDMSFVGPRPELRRYASQYVGEEQLILCVRPGITDLSSIHFSNLNELIDDEDPNRSFEERVLPVKNKLRIKYVKERSLLLDLMLIVKTISRLAGIK